MYPYTLRPWAAAVYLHAIVTGIGEGMSGSVIHDFFMGATLNPRLFAGRDTECATLCSPHHPPHSVPPCARRYVIHRTLYWCTPRRPPKHVHVLSATFTTYPNGARNVIHCVELNRNIS